MQNGYYRLVEIPEGWTDHYLHELWYAYQENDNEIGIIRHDYHGSMYLDEFEQYFEFDASGLDERQEQIAELMDSVHEITQRQTKLTSTIPALTFRPLDSSNTSETFPENSETGLALPVNQPPAVLSKNLKQAKTLLAATKRQIAKRQKELSLILREQELILSTQSKALQEQIEVTSEALYMIGSYLGSKDELIQIRRGKPAPIDEKIVIRQLILYMDEETAMSQNWAQRGGMDYSNVTEFDEWLKNPDHLQQVLPDAKGIVAIKARRQDKFYSDNPFENNELNRLNKCLYLLVRNGDILYRIYTNLWLQDVLFPRRNEFDDLFYESNYDWDTHQTVRKPLRPGSLQYMKAMKSAATERRRFYSVLLLIQGLLDRTKIFHPLPEGRINICNVHEPSEHVKLLTDAENLLGTGKPKFKDWLASINENITVGTRIIGNFSSEFYNRTRDQLPLCYDIYEIESKKQDGFLIRYPSDYSSRRTSYLLKKTDPNIIDFDAVSLADCQFYMNSRVDRHEYQEMLPLLDAVVRMKQEEHNKEEPFRKLLIAEIVKKHKVTVADADSQVDDLISWWKFKVKIKRALLSDDAKALRMITKEFGSRKLLLDESKKKQQSSELLLNTVQSNDLLAVFLRPDGNYTVYYWHNDQNVFVREEVWNNELGCIEAKPWRTIDKRHETWLPVFTHERWKDWKIGASASEHLTDPEIQQVIAEAEKFLVKNKSDCLTYNDEKKSQWLIPLAIAADTGSKMSLFFARIHAHCDQKRPLTGHSHPPEMGELNIKWEKRNNHLEVKLHNLKLPDSIRQKSFYVDGVMDIQKYKKYLPWVKCARIIKLYEDHLDSYIQEIQTYLDFSESKNAHYELSHNIATQVELKLKEIWFEERRRQFDEEYEDDEYGTLWQDFREDLKPKVEFPEWVLRASKFLIERNISIPEMTVEQLVKQAKKFGFDLNERYASDLEKVKTMVIV